MQTTKPKIPRVYVQARDPDTGEAKSVTVYNATPADVIRKLDGDPDTKPRRPRRAPQKAAA